MATGHQKDTSEKDTYHLCTLTTQKKQICYAQKFGNTWVANQQILL